MWNPDNNINIASDCKKLMNWFKKAGVFIDRHWKKAFAISVTFVILFALVVIIAATIIKLSWKDIILNESPFTLLGGIVGAFGLFLTYRQIRTQSKQLKEQSENTRKQIAAEQFKNAIQHLGDSKQAIVLGGVHALHHLAMTFHEEYSQEVFEVLCSFIREETATEEYQQRASKHPSIVIQTIADKLFRKKVEVTDEKTGKTIELYRDFKANLSDAFLRGVNFYEAKLKEANLTSAILEGCKLSGANLQGASLYNANLQEARLWKANLQEAKLLDTNLQGASLYNANLQWANLREANLQGAVLIYANLQWADLQKANLQKTDLRKANLQKADLVEADLQGVDLNDANLQVSDLSIANLQGANLVNANLQEAKRLFGN